jgi:hypothetical protein
MDSYFHPLWLADETNSPGACFHDVRAVALSSNDDHKAKMSAIGPERLELAGFRPPGFLWFFVYILVRLVDDVVECLLGGVRDLKQIIS